MVLILISIDVYPDNYLVSGSMSCDPLAFRGVVREPPRRQEQAPAGSHETTDPAGVKWLAALEH